MKKKMVFLGILLVLLVCSVNAQQILRQATVMFISGGNPAADPNLCIFGNRIEDVTELLYQLNLDGKEVRDLRERPAIPLPEIFSREMERLNVRFISILTYQRRFVGNNLVTYWIADVIERVDNRYYIIADNRY